MFSNLMSQLEEHQGVDGAVERPEFDPRNDRTGWPDDVNPEDRQSIERFVYGKIPDRHRFKTADGDKGIVFFDSRGRATHGIITEIDGEELARLARTFGKKLKGDDGGGRFKPSKDPGYTVPDLAETIKELAPGREFTEDEEVRLVEGMRSATEKEFADAIAKAKWPKPRRMFFGKPDTGSGGMDAIYKDRGTEVASVHVIYKGGKESKRVWMVNAEYLAEE